MFLFKKYCVTTGESREIYKKKKKILIINYELQYLIL